MDALPSRIANRFSSRALLRRSTAALGKLWALPYTVLGVAYGLLCYLPGKLSSAEPRIRLGHNAIQFMGCCGIVDRAALTLGNVILYGHGAEPEHCGAYGDQCAHLGKHEEAHTYQYQLLGPLFLPMYFLSGGCNGPERNPLEHAAQLFATGQGSWWPAAYLPRYMSAYMQSRVINSARPV